MTSPHVAPPELRFLLPEHPAPVGTVLSGASVTYGTLFVLLLLVTWLRPPLPEPIPKLIEKITYTPKLALVPKLDLSGGGGGSGARSLAPPRTSPVIAVKPIEPTPSLTPVENPPPPPDPTPIAAQVNVMPVNAAPAVLSPTTSHGEALGSGNGGNAGDGRGTGNGPDTGDGPGPGFVKGSGGRIYQPGSNGVSMPTLLYGAKPQYTAEAMLRRIHGEVLLSCVVLASGDVGPCSVVKSIESNVYGLDDEARKAAAKFKFRPGAKQGDPVPTQVNIVLEFNMR